MNELAGWSNFFVIVGSSAGALIGLQFVVITLIASRPVRPGLEPANAYATPTIVHFGSVLLLSAGMAAPLRGIEAPAFWGLLGACGLIYCGIVTRRVRRQQAYQPVIEDWLFHVIFPLGAYATLAASAFAPPKDEHSAMFAVAAAALLLLFSGIHNAWDAVTYHIFVEHKKADDAERNK